MSKQEYHELTACWIAEAHARVQAIRAKKGLAPYNFPNKEETLKVEALLEKLYLDEKSTAKVFPKKKKAPETKIRSKNRGRRKGQFWKIREREEAAVFLMQGKSIRQTMEITKLAKGTVLSVRNTLSIPGCQCGKPGGHKGWCSIRFNLSEKRKAVLDSMHNKKEAEVSIAC